MREGLSNDFVRAQRETREGSLWIGTYGGGLNRWRNGRVTALTTRDGLSNDSIISLLEGREGGLWIGTRAGLNRLEDRGLADFAGRKDLAKDFIYALHEDGEGVLWIGTNGEGLKRLKDGRVRRMTTEQGLSSNVVASLAGGRDGSLWIGTYGGGLDRLQNERLTSFTTREGLTSNSVLALYEDPQGALWVGTNGGGLNHVRDGRIAAVTSKEGLFDDHVLAILEDDQGWMWMSCNRGIFRVAKRELEDVLAGRRTGVDSVAYGTADGMRSPECNGGSPAGWKGRDGRLWFSTMRGVVTVDPARLSGNALRPALAVEEVLADDHAVAPAGVLRLPAGTRRLELHYTALSFVDPARVRFRYRLDGFDPDWIEAGARRTAYYTNLPHGDYRFRVIASNNDGLWNETGTAQELTLEPRLHERSWFRALGVLVLGAALYGGHRLRVARLQARQEELTELVDERTRSLRLANEELERLASLDGLTRIANRRVFDETLRTAWAEHRRRSASLAVVLCDVDHFKRYNDLHGHGAGDQALIAVAQALAHVVRRESDLAARYGGEELALLLRDTGPDGAERMSAAVLQAVRALAITHGGSDSAPYVTVSIGVATAVPGLVAEAADLVAAADRALYRAKAEGRDRVVVA